MLSARHAELSYLSTCLDRLSERRPTGVLVSGTAGIGKTALLNAFARKASARGYLVCRVYLGDYGPASPFELWRRGMSEWIEQATRMGRTDAVESIMSESWDVLSGLAPDLFIRYGRPASCDHSHRADPRIDDVTRRLAEEIRHFYYRSTHLIPFVFIVDNLHSADSDSLALIPDIAPVTEEWAAMFVGSFRPERIAAGTGAARIIGHLQSRSGMYTVELGPLSETDVGAYLSDHNMHAGRQTVTAMHSMTGGHPLLLEELRALFARADPVDTDSELQRIADSNDTLTKLNAIMERRLASIEGVDRRILEAAAVLGEDLDIPALVHSVECTRQKATDAMNAARALGIVEKDNKADEPVYRFRHWLVEKSIAATMETDARRSLHAQVATYLYDTLNADNVALLRRTAEHFLSSGDDRYLRRGIHCGLRAARLALRFAGWREAATIVSELEQHYRPRMTGPEQVELDLTLGIVMLYQGDKPEAHRRVYRATGSILSGTRLGEALELILRPEIEDLCDRDFGELLRGLLPGIAESHWIHRSAKADISNASSPYRHLRTAEKKSVSYRKNRIELLHHFEQLAQYNGLDEVMKHSLELRRQFDPADAREHTEHELHSEVIARHAISEAYRVLFRQAYEPIAQRAYAVEALELAQKTGNGFLVAEAYHALFRIPSRALNIHEARRISSEGLSVYPVHDPLLYGRAQVEALAGDYQEALKFVSLLRRNAGTGRAGTDGVGTDGAGADVIRTDGAGTDGTGTNGAGPSASHISLAAAIHSVAVIFGGIRELLNETQNIVGGLLSRNRLSGVIRDQATVLLTAGQCYLDRVDNPQHAYTRVSGIEPGPLLTRGSIERVLMLLAAAGGWEGRVQRHLDLARSWNARQGDRATEILTLAEAASLLSGDRRIAASRLSPGIGAYRTACRLFAEARLMAVRCGLTSVPGLIRPPDRKLLQRSDTQWPTQSLPRAFRT